MPFNDFDVFYHAAQAVLHGQDPYAVYGAYHPFPFFLVFLPLAALPLEAAHIVWTGLELVIFIAIVRKRALYAMLFLPVILTFLMGQIVMPLLAMFALLRVQKHQGIAAAWLCLKPPLIGLMLPFVFWRMWKNERRGFLWFGGIWAVLLGASFLLMPNWVQRWLQVSGERVRMPFAASLWGALSFLPTAVWLVGAGILSLALLMWAYRRADFDILSIVNLLVNPLIVSYDLTLLTLFVASWRMWVLLTALSWLAFAVPAMDLWRGEGPTAVVTLVALVYVVRQKWREQQKERLVFQAAAGMSRQSRAEAIHESPC
jgi:hypothetical protein